MGLMTILGPASLPRTRPWTYRTSPLPGHFDVGPRRELLARSPRLRHRPYRIQRRVVGVVADRAWGESHRALAAAAHGSDPFCALGPRSMYCYQRRYARLR